MYHRSDSSSNERVNDFPMKPASIDEEGDSDLEVEESMPPLDNVIRKELLRKMKPKEKKLQEVINGESRLVRFTCLCAMTTELTLLLYARSYVIFIIS